jgi:hypothetical protein
MRPPIATIPERKEKDELLLLFLVLRRQQQQLERVKKWLQLRNRDSDHRSQVEERRKKREEEAKVTPSTDRMS